ncbi:MAG: tetratricopeptide repeat protein [Lutisporaceae bacterium]
MKLFENDVKILTEGQLLRKSILKMFPNMNKDEAILEYANLADRSPESVARYSRSRIIESKSFKLKAYFLSGAEFPNREEQITEYIESIYNDINEYNAEEDIKVFEKLRDICIKNNYNKQLARLYWCMGKYYNIISKSNISVEYYKLAINMYDNIDDMISKTMVKTDLGLIYLLIGECSNAIGSYESILADEYSCRLLEQKDLFFIYYRLGIAFIDNDENNKARRILEKSLTYAVDNVVKGHILKNIGISYKKQKQYKKALEYCNQALECFDISDSKNISIVKNNIAMLYLTQGKLNDALDNIKMAMDMLNDNKELGLMYNYLDTYTLIMIRLGEPMEAFELLLDLTEHTSDYIRYKKNILQGIKTLLDYSINYKYDNILLRIQNIIVKLIKKNESYQEFTLHLKAYLGDIYYSNYINEEV